MTQRPGTHAKLTHGLLRVHRPNVGVTDKYELIHKFIRTDRLYRSPTGKTSNNGEYLNYLSPEEFTEAKKDQRMGRGATPATSTSERNDARG